MKNFIAVTLALAIVIPTLAQSKGYKEAMTGAIQMMNMASSPESFHKSIRQFEDLSATYPDQWLPCYYQAQALAMLSLREKDIPTIDRNLDRAQAAIEKADSIHPEESEIYVIKALLNLGRITVDPVGRGAIYFETVSSDILKARELYPENPRALFIQALFTLYMPEFLGGGPAGAKPKFLDAAEKFKSFAPPEPLWPDWGEDLNQDELEKLKDI